MTRLCYKCKKTGHEESECPYCPECHHWYGIEKKCYSVHCVKKRLGVKRIPKRIYKQPNPYNGIPTKKKKRILDDNNESGDNKLLVLISS